MNTWPLLAHSDAALVKGALDKAPRAFELLVVRYQCTAAAIVRAIGVNPADVQDVLQNAFLQAFKNLNQLRQPALFRAWFLSIVRNAARTQMSKTHQQAAVPLPESLEAHAVKGLEEAELRDLLWRKVSQLPESLREAVFLFYQDGESVGKVAKILGVSRSAVKMRLKRGRELLRKDFWKAFKGSLKNELPAQKTLRSRARSLSLLAATICAGGKDGQAAALGSASAVTAATIGGVSMVKTIIWTAAAVFLLFISGAFVYIQDPFGLQNQEDTIQESPQKEEDHADIPETGGLDPVTTAKTVKQPEDAPTPTLKADASPVLPLKQAAYIGGYAYLRDLSHPLRNDSFSIRRNHATGYSGNKVMTDDEGAFSSEPFPSGDHEVTFKYQSFQPITLKLNLTEARPADDLTLVFLDGITVEGTLRNAGGAPLPWVILDYKMADAALGHKLACTTDAEGRFALKGLEPGACRVTFHDENPKRRSPSPSQVIDVLDAPVQSMDLLFDVKPPIVIQVTDTSGDPFAGGLIHYRYKGMGVSRESTTPVTDENGFTGLVGLPGQGKLTLWGGNRTAGSGRRTVDLSEVDAPILLELQPWDIVADQEENPVPDAGDDRVVQGRVLSPDGEPVSGALVFIELPDKPRHHPAATTDKEGRFAVDAEGGPFQIRVKHAGFILREPVPDVRPGPPALDIVMEPVAERMLSGRVFHLGTPIEGASVRLYLMPENKYRLPQSSMGHRNATDSQGRFTFKDIPPASSEGIVVAQGPQFGFATSEAFQMPPDGTLENIEVVSIPGYDFELLVKAPDGQPAGDVIIWLKSKGKPPLEAQGRTDASGKWQIPQLPTGDYRITVYARTLHARAVKSFSWERTSAPLTIKLK